MGAKDQPSGMNMRIGSSLLLYGKPRLVEADTTTMKASRAACIAPTMKSFPKP